MTSGSDDGQEMGDDSASGSSDDGAQEKAKADRPNNDSKMSFPAPASRIPAREDTDEKMGFPVNLIAIVIVGLLAIGGWLYPMDDDEEDENGDEWDLEVVQIILLEATQGSDNSIVVTVVGTLGAEASLTDFSYFLRDGSGLTQQFGLIGLGNHTSRSQESDVWHGIDITWDDDGDHDLDPGNGVADRNASAGGPYSDPRQAQIRIDGVQAGVQGATPHQKSEGTISVSFIDGDRDGKLTQGDRFIIRAFSKDHTANYDYRLDIQYEPTGDTIGSSLFFKHFMPLTALFSQTNEDGSYTVHVVQTTYDTDLKDLQYFLKDPSYRTYQYGEIALQNISGKWHGIDVTWDDDGSADTNQGNNKADRAASAGGAYSDTTQAQIRTDAIQAGNQSSGTANQRGEGNISVSFHDNDFNGKLSAGDLFIVQGDPADDEHYFELKYDLTSDIISSIKLG